MRKRIAVPFVTVLAVAFAAPFAPGYIHFPPTTLSKMCKDSSNIRVLSVKKHDGEKGVVLYELADTLKGDNAKGMSFKHSIGKKTEATKPIFDWLGAGKKAVMFTIEGGNIACGYVFIDEFCYSVDYSTKGDYWLLIRVDPKLSATYHGTAEKLQSLAKDLLAGKDVKVPVKVSAKLPTTEERRKMAKGLNDIMVENRKK